MSKTPKKKIKKTNSISHMVSYVKLWKFTPRCELNSLWLQKQMNHFIKNSNRMKKKRCVVRIYKNKPETRILLKRTYAYLSQYIINFIFFFFQFMFLVFFNWKSIMKPFFYFESIKLPYFDLRCYVFCHWNYRCNDCEQF